MCNVTLGWLAGGASQSARLFDEKGRSARSALCLVLTLVATPSCPAPGEPSDADASDHGFADAGVDVGVSPWLDADQYCEQSGAFFCPFYLRCGRMVAEDLDACLRVFAETCEEVYEPLYVALEAEGLLRLSREGLDACAAYLQQVPCGQHLMDLEGPCRDIWRGTAAQGHSCGLGVESFVCDGDTVCALDLSFCGECRPAAATGQVCGEGVSCRYPDLCVDDLCVGPHLPGETCDTEVRCIAGASCSTGLCVGREFVGVGEVCDAQRRCQYRSFCRGGTCVQAALLDEPCAADRPCASGFCAPSTSVCQSFHRPGQACVEDGECLSGLCEGERCGPLLSGCLVP